MKCRKGNVVDLDMYVCVYVCMYVCVLGGSTK